ncbi:MAG: hypothetical protein P4M12_11625 [Gammaproteobacteria bacterium]|nr:hypothetical protein [Gammaproteobacteria bacterium]
MNSRINQLCDLAANKNTTVDEIKEFIGEEVALINGRHTEHRTHPIAFAAQRGNLTVLRYFVEELHVELFHAKTYNLFQWASSNTDDIKAYLSNTQDRLWEKFKDGSTDFHADIAGCRYDEITAKLKNNPDLILESTTSGINSFAYANKFFKNRKVTKLLVSAGKAVLKKNRETINWKSTPEYFEIAAMLDTNYSSSCYFMQKCIALTWDAIEKIPEVERQSFEGILLRRINILRLYYTDSIDANDNLYNKSALQEVLADTLEDFIYRYEKIFSDNLHDLYQFQFDINYQLANTYVERGIENQKKKIYDFVKVLYEKALTTLNVCFEISSHPLLANDVLTNTATLQSLIKTTKEKIIVLDDEVLNTLEPKYGDEEESTLEELEGVISSLTATKNRTPEQTIKLHDSIYRIAVLLKAQADSCFDAAIKAKDKESAGINYNNAFAYYKQAIAKLNVPEQLEFHSKNKSTLIIIYKALSNACMHFGNVCLKHIENELCGNENFYEWHACLNDLNLVRQIYNQVLLIDDELMMLEGNVKTKASNLNAENILITITQKEDFIKEILGMQQEDRYEAGASSSSVSVSASSSSATFFNASMRDQHNNRFEEVKLDSEEERYSVQTAYSSSSSSSSSVASPASANLSNVNNAHRLYAPVPTRPVVESETELSSASQLANKLM